jgi:hypothetical protein
MNARHDDPSCAPERDRPRRRSLLAATAFVMLFHGLSTPPLTAQRVEFDGVASRTDNAVMRRAFGYSARLSVPVLPFISAAVGYSRIAGSGDIDDPTCAGTGCPAGPLRNDIVFGTVDYELMLPLRLFGFELSAAAGIDATTVESPVARSVATGELVEAYAPDHGLLGSLTDLNGRHYRFGAGISLFGLPVTLRAAWQRRMMNLDACSADAWSPFCGEMRSDQVLLGVSIGAR